MDWGVSHAHWEALCLELVVTYLVELELVELELEELELEELVLVLGKEQGWV